MQSCFSGDPNAKTVLIRIAGEHNLNGLEEDAAQIRDLTDREFLLVNAIVDDWNADLSPWPAPPVFGNEAFGDGAEKTLAYLLEELLPKLSSEAEDRIFYLGGYSLAGLFALWAGSRTDAFSGIAAASPSVWFPGFLDYVKDNPLQSEAIYLSLGDKEERTRHPVMSQVGNAIRDIYGSLQARNIPCTLEWNPGNHFRDPGLRMARGFAWLMNRKG